MPPACFGAFAVGPKDPRHSTPEMEEPGERGAEGEPAPDDHAAVKALALEHVAATEEADPEGDGPAVDGGAGQIFGWLEKMFEDPARPTPCTSEPWAEAALGPEEVHRMYGFVATLGHKVTRVPPEHRRPLRRIWRAATCRRRALYCCRIAALAPDVPDRGFDLSEVCVCFQVKYRRSVVGSTRLRTGLNQDGRLRETSRTARLPRASRERAVCDRAREGGEEGSLVVRRVPENAKWRRSRLSLLWYELLHEHHKLLYFFINWRSGRDSNPRPPA